MEAESKAKTIGYHHNKTRKEYSILERPLRTKKEQYDHHGARTKGKMGRAFEGTLLNVHVKPNEKTNGMYWRYKVDSKPTTAIIIVIIIILTLICLHENDTSTFPLDYGNRDYPNARIVTFVKVDFVLYMNQPEIMRLPIPKKVFTYRLSLSSPEYPDKLGRPWRHEPLLAGQMADLSCAQRKYVVSSIA